ncbi:MAG: hypothetical protein K0R54_84 [Clostridiaceae bacterium]|jgi:hypothetical protein|nr:hypothetical protein [Clostridiaceae bacterium]
MKDKNTNQILRFDGKNVFMEVMRSAFAIGKVQINFIEYDVSQQKNSRQKKNIQLYMDMDKFLGLSADILSGKMAVLAKQAKEAKEKGGYKYCKEIFNDMGGISAENLKKRGKERPDGKSMSRQFKITPGDKMPWILSGETGAGEENETGLIVPRGNPEEIVRVALQDDDLKRFAKTVEARIIAYFASQETLEAIKNDTELKGLIDLLKEQLQPKQ